MVPWMPRGRVRGIRRVTAREFRAFLFFLLCIFAGVIAVHVGDTIDEWRAEQEATDGYTAPR